MNSIFITNPNASLFLLEHNVKSLEEEQMLKYTWGKMILLQIKA